MNAYEFRLHAFKLARSRIDDLHELLSFSPSKIELVDNGTLDTVLAYGDIEVAFSSDDIDRDEDGEPIIERYHEDILAEQAYERFNESFLCVDFHEAEDTHDGKAFYSLLISWGGPSEEIRVYGEGDYRFWYLDWFKGEETFKTLGADISMNTAARKLGDIVGHFVDCECFDWERLAESNAQHEYNTEEIED